MRPNDYLEFSSFFDPLIREYHKATKEMKHETNWQIGEQILDVEKVREEDNSNNK